MIGNRIRLTRQANCLSLQQLSEKVSSYGLPLTKTALFNYEAGKTTPNESVLQTLASILGTPIAFFYQPDRTFTLHLFDEPAVANARQQELLAYIQIELERFFDIAAPYLDSGARPAPASEPVSLSDPESVERTVDGLRRLWQVGPYPIASVCSLLEYNGWALFSLPNVFNRSYVSGWEESMGLPFIFSAPEPFLDDFRRQLLQELGRYILRYDPAEEAELLPRFARAFLLPKDCVIREFGSGRALLQGEEMSCIKKKYGISRRDILKRLWECGVINQDRYDQMLLNMQQNHYFLREKQPPQLLNFCEEPTAMHLYGLRAVSEGKSSVWHRKPNSL